MHERPLIGSVFERTATGSSSLSSSKFSGTPGTGFPIAQHRFKSVFARAREETNATGGGSSESKRIEVPPILSTNSQAGQRAKSFAIPTTPIVDQTSIPADTDALRRQIHEENVRTIEAMSDDEIEQEKRAILEQLGGNTGELLRRAQEARRRREVREKEAQGQEQSKECARGGKERVEGRTTDHDHVPLVASPTPRRVLNGLATRPGILRVKSLENMRRSLPSPLPAMSSTRPSSRTGRKLRFAELTPDDVHVYESAPRSPKRTVLALPPPPDAKDDSIISLGTFRKDSIPSKRTRQMDDGPTDDPTPYTKQDDDPEEGTPEYIRRRYFPDVPANDPSLAWTLLPETTNSSTPRFDLHGTLIPPSLSATLPSHLGLHHHAEGSHAGYTIDDIFLLTRSTVPAQRASMLGVLGKIARRLGLQARCPDSPERMDVFAGQEGQLRKRIMTAGLAAIDQVGSLGARAIEVVWESLVGWDNISQVEGVELVLAPDVVSSSQLEYLLPQITDVLSHATVPAESLAQLLDIVHWFAQQSNQIADMIVNTPRLVPTILNTFLMVPIPLKEDTLPPNPTALRLLITLASASRANATALRDPADALLRFVTLLPPSSPYSPTLAITLLTYTLQFYATLSLYGLYSHIATIASEVFTALSSFVHDNARVSDLALGQLRIAWTSLVEAWTVCAIDPHATSPPHEILWSQMCAWGWATDVRKLREGLRDERSDWAVYAATWDAEATWLEGARINGVKGGEEEREEALQILRSTFAAEDGSEFVIVRHALEAAQCDLGQAVTQDGEHVLKSLASAGRVLVSALRLWLACLPPLNSAPLSTPPFSLPFSDLSAFAATLVKHPIWALPLTLGAAHLRVHLRPLTRFLVCFHRVSRHIPGTTPQLWFAQALVFLPRLLPGDESDALGIFDAFSLVTPCFAGVDPAELPQDIHIDVLRPFFEYTVRPEKNVYVAPFRPNAESIARSSTLRLPPPSQRLASGGEDDTAEHLARAFTAGLPLTRDFLFTPLTHLLRSGTSPVFRVPPDNWTASEVDIVRATLLLAYAARTVSVAHGLAAFVHGASEVVFACMRVCMLEHGVGSGGTEMEVFRDAAVERLMALLLEPFTVRAGLRRGQPTATSSTHPRTLEDASALSLGSTPFYQFYTDLVALYGAVSFGHPTFATLVVTPLAMRYPVDYRRALWCGGDRAGSAGPGPAGDDGGGAGLGDVVRSVRVPIEDVICTVDDGRDPREYLYPIERDVGVLGAYAAALVARDGSGAEGFLRLIAVHHVACTVWGETGMGVVQNDTETVPPSEADETRWDGIRARLLRAVLMRGGPGVVRDVVLYRQCHPRGVGAFVPPPACYDGSGEGFGWREARLAFVHQTFVGAEEAMRERVGALLGIDAVFSRVMG